jgi:hypothetical protein
MIAGLISGGLTRVRTAAKAQVPGYDEDNQQDE